MKEIQLTRGYVALVDDEDYARLSLYIWCADLRDDRVYAARRQYIGNGRGRKVYMHRVIMDAVPGEEIDHREGIGLDNRGQNLRRCTRTQNLGNQKRRVNNTSGVKGVRIIRGKRGVRYVVRVSFQGKEYHGGTFRSLDAAAQGYLKKASELYGEFARIA